MNRIICVGNNLFLVAETTVSAEDVDASEPCEVTVSQDVVCQSSPVGTRDVGLQCSITEGVVQLSCAITNLGTTACVCWKAQNQLQKPAAKDKTDHRQTDLTHNQTHVHSHCALYVYVQIASTSI